ncbi:MAG: aminofutalosine synthase MqnE [Thermodesulfovibrionia bacterium]
MLKGIEKKVFSGKRITPEEAIFLFESDDIFTLARLASHISHKKNGDNVYFIQNHHINPTNICVNRCKFCAFSRSKGDKGAYELSINEIIKKLKTQGLRFKTPFREVHIVGGLHPEWSFDLYLKMIMDIKRSFPDIHIKAFTPVEIDYFSRISGLSIKKVLMMLKDAGLDMMPGGGAEIFNKGVRNRLCPEKISGERWLKIMETAHRLGIKSNATMLYGHIEKYEHRVDHMLKLRELQDRTGGFQAFIPLTFHQRNTEIEGGCSTSGIDDLKTIAISRIFLDNFQHIKAYWIALGEKVAQLALNFGADDLDGTIIEERIAHSAGAVSGYGITRDELINIIIKAGKTPVERDSFYNPKGNRK